jgi:hypothetical protein
MDLTIEERAVELQDAFIRHIRHLEQEYEHQVSQLPQSGKAVETTADVSRERSFRSRIAFFESCIQNTTLIASKFPEWTNGLDRHQARDRLSFEISRPQCSVMENQAFGPDDDIPFYNPFSGKMVVPTTAFSAGTSRTGNPFSSSYTAIDKVLEPPPSPKFMHPSSNPIVSKTPCPPTPCVRRNPFCHERDLHTVPASTPQTSQNAYHVGFIDSMMPPKVTT